MDCHFLSDFSLNINKVSFVSVWYNNTNNCDKFYVIMPHSKAPSSFSLIPPTGKTLPVRVISPVIAMLLFTLSPVRRDTMAVVMAIPAEGPSLGVAPAGK